MAFANRSSVFRSGAPFVATAVLLAGIAWSRGAVAGGPIGPNGSTITTSEYVLDLHQGPVFAGARVTGLGGAYVAIAEDVDGDLQNPAAPAVRPFFSYTFFDYWLGFGLTFPATLQNMDFFNSGSKTNVTNPPDAFVFFTPALNLQFGNFGIGYSLALQQYTLSSAEPSDSDQQPFNVSIPTMHMQVAYGFMRNQLVAGVGLRYVSMGVSREGVLRSAFTSSGLGAEIGGVWKPDNLPLRLGVAYRSQIDTLARYTDELLPNSDGDLVVQGSDGPRYLPTAVAMPWDINFGFAVQFGDRPFNPPWVMNRDLIERTRLIHSLRELDRRTTLQRALAAAHTPEERAGLTQVYEKEQELDDRELDAALLDAKWHIERQLLNMNRFYVQISGAMLVTGQVEEAVGIESMITQTVNRSGQKAVVSPRLGVESGVIPDWLKLRAGTYLEPTRFEDSHARMHVTAGFDLRLAIWRVFGLWPDDYMWRLGFGLDVAERYSTWGITLAGWYPRHQSAETIPDPLDPEANRLKLAGE